ncbi:MAG TPA: bifunctional YncE family protein/alkaline phosphatase family protein [Flavitalea sp.]|nr:bifunctional YncE family protein/alkaline phosphatase family protein [Flavitalea sp.]
MKQTTILGTKKVGPQPDGSILVPSNQLLRPVGFQVSLPGRPVDLALSQDEKLLFVKNNASLDLIRVNDRTILQSLPYKHSGASFTGICLSPDGQRAYVTDATEHINIAELEENILHWKGSITLPKPAIGGYPVPGGLAMNGAEDKVYVTLSRSNLLSVVNLKDTADIIQIPVGIAPYDVIIASSNKAYVSNWGGRKPTEGETTYNTSGSQVLVDIETGIANNGSVSVIDLDKNIEVKSIEVGLHPAGMILSPANDKLYVACANSDIITVISTKTDQVIDTISVHMQKDIPFGSAPNALAISPDGKYLYVANGTENAICVIQTATPYHVLGYIPAGWYPGSVVLNKSGNVLYVANVKGVGSRNQKTHMGGYNSHDNLGTVSIIPVPDKQALLEMTKIVHENNAYSQMLTKLRPANSSRQKVPVPLFPGQPSHFKHVVYIIKENRTYDQVLSDIPQGNGDTSLLEFGKEVTPNHHRLAESFVLMDNFNCSGLLSADGHQWTDAAYVTDYLEKSYDGYTRSYPFDGNDALAYASSGFIWDNVLKHGLSLRDYGEFVETIIEPTTANFSDIYQDFINGTNKISIRAKATIEQLEPYICPTYPAFTNNIPDAYRAATFIKELKGYEQNNNFPNFIIMELPNDHTSGLVPGRPTPKAAVADNDLALGQIVEAISHSKFWKETCIFVTEDDPQDGLDHVDGHRTVGFVISPYTKRGKVLSTYYSQINMLRTIENILGIPPMNQLDLTADPMLDCFTYKPDFTPYTAIRNNIPLNQLNLALDKIKGDELYWAKKSLEQDLDRVDQIDEDDFNRIIWHSVKGYDTPYPILAREPQD